MLAMLLMSHLILILIQRRLCRLTGNVLVEHTQPVMPLTCDDIVWHVRAGPTAGRAGARVLKVLRQPVFQRPRREA